MMKMATIETSKTATVVPLRVLHAEDEPSDALLCQFQLETAGVPVQRDVVTTREDFLRALAATNYDVVLTDYKLPGWSGLEVLQILHKDERQIPCILVTGAVGEEIAAECIKLGATDYILKDRPARLPLAIRAAIEERNAKERRRETETIRNRLASIVESSPDAIIGTSETGSILSWNPGAEAMFGYAQAEVMGQPLANLFCQVKDGAEAAFEELLPVNASIQRYEAEGRKKNGEVMLLAVTLSPILHSDGGVSGTSAIVRDVTQEGRRQKELFSNQKMEAIGQLAGGVAHDFNNLLTVINGYARMLKRKACPDPEKLDAILQAGERGQRLTKQLLAFSRQQMTQLVPVDLNALVNGFLNMLRPLIGAHVELRTTLAPELSCVLADPGQMEQVIMNLVVNARDAMPDGGTIHIETRTVRASGEEEAPTVELSVSDTGMGMTPEVQARIFEPFFTTKEVGKGTGLGLAATRGIVARCDGKLAVTSELGKGTSFSLRLPACGAAHTPCAENSSSDDVTAAQCSGTIVLAEDEPGVRDFAKSVLSECGYQVLVAENGRLALDLCASHSGPIVALVTDVAMPEMSGPTLAARARLARPDLRVLYLSGYIKRGLTGNDITQTASGFLQKPFSAEDLIHAIRILPRGPDTAAVDHGDSQPLCAVAAGMTGGQMAKLSAGRGKERGTTMYCDGAMNGKSDERLRTLVDAAEDLLPVDRAATSAEGELLRDAMVNLLTLSRDILDFSTVEPAAGSWPPMGFCLKTVLYQALAKADTSAMPKAQTLRTELSPGIPNRLGGDPGPLQRILTCLFGHLRNRMGFGTILVAALPDPANPFHVHFSISALDADPAAVQPQPVGLSDLELVLCRLLLRQMGGDLARHSTPGETCKFLFDAVLKPLPQSDQTGLKS
jgi:two-component system cell cycle sensor histidine kinase/response regulator CckA